MAIGLGNAAKLGIGAMPTYIAAGQAITWDPGKATLVPDNLLNTAVDTLYASGSRTNASIKISVAADKADTNGQVALNTAWKSGTDVQFTLAREGTTSGSEKITGNAKVETIGSMAFTKDKVIMRDITLLVSGDYTEGVFP